MGAKHYTVSFPRRSGPRRIRGLQLLFVAALFALVLYYTPKGQTIVGTNSLGDASYATAAAPHYPASATAGAMFPALPRGNGWRRGGGGGGGGGSTGSSSRRVKSGAVGSHVYTNTLHRQGNTAVEERHDFDSPCRDFPDMSDVVLVMKTGASEAYEKLPVHLLTSLQCVPDFLLFSDMEQQMGKYHIHNVLDRVLDTVRTSNDVFHLYEDQLRCPLSQKMCSTSNRHRRKSPSSSTSSSDPPTSAWELDKYKFLHMVVRAWEMRPHKRWYVFAEADSYLFWPNLMLWLRTRAASSPDAELYAGNAALADGFPFAHGGSGYVISGALMARLLGGGGGGGAVPRLTAKYDAAAPDTCCGDVLLGRALAEVNASVAHLFPMFNGERTNSLAFGENHWCEPILTLHHMDAEQVAQVWQFEQTRTKRSPIQIKDLYHQFISPHISPLRNEWDNLSDDVCFIAPDAAAQEAADSDSVSSQRPQADKSPPERDAHLSAASCAAACLAGGLDLSEEAWNKAKVADGVPLPAKDGKKNDGNNSSSSSSSKDSQSGGGGEKEGGHPSAARQDLLEHLFDAAKPKDRRSCFQWRYRKGVCWHSRSFKLGNPAPPPADADDSSSKSSKSDITTSGWHVRAIQDFIDDKGDCALRWQDPQ